MSKLKVAALQGLSASSDAITLANDGTCTANITNNLSNRRLTINGDMQIAQRSTSKNTTGASSAYGTVDRMQLQIQSGTITESQQDLATSDSPYSLGFRKYFRLLNQSGIGAGAAMYCQADHIVEAQDIAKSGWNYTSSSSFITLSFWVRASVTQVYYGWLMVHDGTQRHYPYKICDSGGTTLTADTWTKITVTVPGNSGLTINNDNGVGMRLSFVPYYGTNYTSSNPTLNAWNATGSGGDYTPDMTTTWATTTNATFDITGIQLEVGSVATDFEHRSFGQELALCQRYCYVWESSTAYANFNIGYATSATNVETIYQLPVIMRASPSLATSGTFRFVGVNANGQDSSDLSSLSINRGHTRSLYMRAIGSGLSVGLVGEFGDGGANNATAIFSAEL